MVFNTPVSQPVVQLFSKYEFCSCYSIIEKLDACKFQLITSHVDQIRNVLCAISRWINVFKEIFKKWHCVVDPIAGRCKMTSWQHSHVNKFQPMTVV